MKKFSVLFAALFLLTACPKTEKFVTGGGGTDLTGGTDPNNCPQDPPSKTALSLKSPEENKSYSSAEMYIEGDCESDLGSVFIRGTFKGEKQEVECNDDKYRGKVSFEHRYGSNKLEVKQDDQSIGREVHIFPRVAYCGDGEVNQNWEKCDGGRDCNEVCHPVNQVDHRDVILARVVYHSVQNTGAGSLTNNTFVGSAKGAIPSGAWFAVYDGQDTFRDPKPTSFMNVPGLAISREDTKLHVYLHGSMGRRPAKDKSPGSAPGMEHASGIIEYYNGTPTDRLESSTSAPLERGFDGVRGNAGQDDVSVEYGRVNFWLSVTTHDDGFTTSWDKAFLPNP